MSTASLHLVSGSGRHFYQSDILWYGFEVCTIPQTYPNEVVEAWKSKLQARSGQPLALRHEDNALTLLTCGFISLVEDVIDFENCTLEAFAATYTTNSKPPS